MPNAGLLAGIVAYLAAGRWIVARMTGVPREMLFGLLNVAACYAWFFGTQDSRYRVIFVAYLAVVGGQYLTMRWFAECQDRRVWLAFFSPIAALVLIRYLPTSVYATFVPSMRDVIRRNPEFSLAPFFVGISYLAFRTSHLVLEVRNGVARKPGLWEYLGFSFFVPTMAVGPINTYSNFRSGFGPHPPAIPPGRAALRVLVGLVKYRFLGALCNQLTYSAILLDGRRHGWLDLIVAAVFYYLFLYCNFSGFCDIAVGGAGLMGVPVSENFANPFGARNLKEFWNRWHITLSDYMRDVVFSPLSRALVRVLGLAASMGTISAKVLVVGCEPQDFGDELEGRMGLSSPVQAAVEEAADMVLDLAAAWQVNSVPLQTVEG